MNIRGIPYAASQLKHRLTRALLTKNVPKERRNEMKVVCDAFDLINCRCAADEETAKVFCENANKLIEWRMITNSELETLVESSAGVGW